MSFTIQKVLNTVNNGYEIQDMQIEGDAIAAIASQLPASGTVVDGENKLLLPGFFNVHTHSSEWQRGIIPPVPLELWIAQLYDCGA